MKFFLAIYIFLFISLESFSQNITIHIKESSSSIAISNATIKIPELNLSSISDSMGKVEFKNLPSSYFSIEISAVSYSKVILKTIKAESNKTKFIEVELEPHINTLNQIVVKGISRTNSSSITSLKSIELEEILRLPATFYDPARLAMSFAGVANTDDQANNISIRGNSPQTLQWRLDGVEIVNPNHLSNAGTISDQPTFAGGGTNILSAQMLGNMTLHTGAFSPEYGNVTGGIMDMNFRNGNTERHAKTIQVGLIGVDLSAEGPLSKSRNTSYLFNYRYSFTGLLGLMGITFGGESIKFQDFALNINHKTKRLGEFSIFAMGGNSSNIFAPPLEKDLILTQKDLGNIDFYCFMALVGVKHSIKLSKNWNWQTTIVESGLQNLRSAYRQAPFNLVSYQFQSKNIFGGNSYLTGVINNTFNIKTGVNLNHFFDEYNALNSDQDFYSVDRIIVQPFVSVSNHIINKWKYNIGFNAPYYQLSNRAYFEPRLSTAYYINPSTTLAASYGLHSQQFFAYESISSPSFPVRSHHFNLMMQKNIQQKSSINIEAFFQSYFQIPNQNGYYVSPLNGFPEFNTLNNYTNTQNQGINYGLESSYSYFLNKGLYIKANATLFRSKYLAFDNVYYPTRNDSRYIFNLSLGKEWLNKKGRVYGVNTRLNYVGGLVNYALDEAASKVKGETIYSYNKPASDRNPAYFRPDLRLYKRKTVNKKTTTLSLDFQNVSNTQNKAYQYYDSYLSKVVSKNQLGLLPLLNYRIEF
jgi:TonB-dependent Receptor Plug Domain